MEIQKFPKISLKKQISFTRERVLSFFKSRFSQAIASWRFQKIRSENFLSDRFLLLSFFHQNLESREKENHSANEIYLQLQLLIITIDFRKDLFLLSCCEKDSPKDSPESQKVLRVFKLQI